MAADGNKHGKKVLGVSNGGECQNINPQMPRKSVGMKQVERGKTSCLFYDPWMWFKQTTTRDYMDFCEPFFFF